MNICVAAMTDTKRKAQLGWKERLEQRGLLSGINYLWQKKLCSPHSREFDSRAAILRAVPKLHPVTS